MTFRRDEVGRCREAGCGAIIVFARTSQGRSMPMDSHIPDRDDEKANLAWYRDGQGKLVVRVVTKEYQRAGFEKPGIPHFATCVPYARRQKAAAEAKKLRQLHDAGEASNVVDLFSHQEGNR